MHQRAVALEHRCSIAWHVEALGGGKSLPEGIRSRFGRSDGAGFIGFWEAMARRALRARTGAALVASELALRFLHQISDRVVADLVQERSTS